MSSQEAVDFVIEKLEDQVKKGEVCLSKICEQVCRFGHFYGSEFFMISIILDIKVR